MTDTVKLEWSDICRHEHRCEGGKMFYHTVPSYSVYLRANEWLREERGCQWVSVEGERIDSGNTWYYTGRYTFKFMCKQEYILFVLRWM